MSKSKSSSQANQTTSQQDNRIAASDSAIAVGAGATLVQETVSDDIAVSAIEESTRVAREGLATSRDVVDSGADLARDLNSDSLTFAGGVLDTAASVFERQLSESTAAQRGLAETAIQNIEKNKRDADSDVIQTVAKYAATAAVVIVVGVGAVLLIRRK